MKYSDALAEWLVELGYTHCFYVSGGNIMHLSESINRRMVCKAVVHEVAAGIAAEYFNEASAGTEKAFALVTAGPGLTNIITSLAGAYLESRELLVIGGQVKTSDLARSLLRQRGIQEIDGVALARPVTKTSILIDEQISKTSFVNLVSQSWSGRKGPVFLEIPLDIQGGTLLDENSNKSNFVSSFLPKASAAELDSIISALHESSRPVFLIGGGITRSVSQALSEKLKQLGIPIATTWNAVDRIGADHPCYVGRPNTWGQRSSNIILQQSDLIIAFGSRLGLQQTGFNWQQFAPLGKVIHIDIDKSELNKGHPKLYLQFEHDANDLLERIADKPIKDFSDWLSFCNDVRESIPLIENDNHTGLDFISPYVFIDELSKLSSSNDTVIPCSSGGAFTVFMQTFTQKTGQITISNKGLASMGYGLSGAIGAAFAHPRRKTILIEGDGGFSQNLQEIGTAAINQLNIKIFIFDDSGYASIRMTQKNYFNGSYIGCDRQSGLGLPNWDKLFDVWDIPVVRLGRDFQNNSSFLNLFNREGPAAFIVSIDPQQTYFPKISSRVIENGSMLSNPLHLMTPELSSEISEHVMKFF
jgi:acetolactate synthase-1/2/3 large subunit